MIAALRGEVLGKSKDAVVLRVGGGMGYRVQMPTLFLAEAKVGQELFCYTHLAIRKQQWNFFGFKTYEEMELFELLITVQKVGPRVGLAALSTMKQQALASAIASGRAEVLTRIPGIGLKTAKRIILDLKEKVGDYAGDMVIAAERDDKEAISALMALAYTKTEALAALKEVPGTNLELQDKIWLALQYLNKLREGMYREIG